MEENKEKESKNLAESKENNLIEERKKKLVNFVKKSNWLIYFILGLIITLSVYIRTRNLNNLKDITTGTWTLGPDLDPFLFLRWAEEIVKNGSLAAVDTMRYVPLGFDTAGEMKLLSYMIAWFYQITSIFYNEMTITLAAIIFPVVMFVFTCIAFFFLTKEIFKNSFENKRIPDLIALIATLFLAVIPSLLPRTIAGIPEKESAGFLFIFLSLLFLIKSFKSKTYKWSIINGIIAGFSTTILGLLWGGSTFVYLTIGISVFICFILGQVNKKEFFGYTALIVTVVPSSMLFSSRYSIMNYITSTSTIPIYITWLAIFVNLFLYKYLEKINLIKRLESSKFISKELLVLFLVIILLFIASLFILGPKFVPEQVTHLSNNLLSALGTNRFSLTVAENRQPYFDEWKSSFGPVIGNLPLFFWLFILGSIILIYFIFKKFQKKDRIIVTVGYIVFIMGLIFSRYSSSSRFNGTNNISLFLYFGSMILFISVLGYFWYKYHKQNNENSLKIEFEFIILIILFFVSILAARSGIRFVMVLVPPASIIVGFFVGYISSSYFNTKDETKKLVILILAIILIISSIYSIWYFYQVSSSQAESFYPGDSYHVQWQKAMSWTRNNTAENSVFAHWWDYGYWLQSIGKRATVLDGGNAIVYWDHLMGREVLTNPDSNDKTALEFLYTHNTTHLLIDSTDIGKYSAFSSIGSDEKYDRFSYISTFILDGRQTKETSEAKIYVYTGGFGLDEDIVWKENQTTYNLPKETSGIIGIIIEQDLNGSIKQPLAIFTSSGGKQIGIPIKYLYYNKTKFTFENGLESGIFLMPLINSNGQSLSINEIGGCIYLSRRTVNSLLVRKYLFSEEGSFKLVHSEPNGVIEQIETYGNKEIGDFAVYGGNILGPIKIWEIDYPVNIKFNESYLKTNYPSEGLWKVKSGEYSQ
ncbi:MAG TPA: STT3 domain-containing protein [Candidatus Paceibacterota bacterium]|nr:STT3 domain-containing protein [Candidatus Paceibacterota bacterium]